MLGLDETLMRRHLKTKESKELVSSKKPESGKSEVPRLTTAATATLKSALREYDISVRSLASHLGTLSPGMSASSLLDQWYKLVEFVKQP
eukprot:3499183-Amphidinium_carterae.1